MNPSCHPSHVASQAKAEKTPCHKHAQALSLTHTQTCTTPTHMCTHAPVRIRVCVRTRVHRRVPTHRYSPAHIHTCTHTHALHQSPGTQGQEPQQAAWAQAPGRPGPMSPLTSSLAQLVPGSPWGPGPLASGRPGGRAWRHEARLATLPLGHSAPPPAAEIHTWVLLPGLWCSLLDGPCSPATSPRAALPHPPRRAEGPPPPAPLPAPPLPLPSSQHNVAMSSRPQSPPYPGPKPGATFGFGSWGVTWLLLMCLWAAQPWNGDPRLQRGASDHRVTNVGMDIRTHRGQARVLREHVAGRGWGRGGRARSRKARQVGRGCGPQEA